MEDNNWELPLIFNKKTFVSIIGIGGEAGRIVNQTQACELPDTELSVFGMNSIGTATMVAEPVHWAVTASIQR